MRKRNIKELKQKEIEQYYAEIYATRCLKGEPEFIETDIHPDCLFKLKNQIIAVEATGYFYQQETDYSNRIYKKVNKVINNKHYINDIYKSIGRLPLLNIIDAIYYNNLLELFNDLIKDISVIEEIEINNNYFYNRTNLIYNAIINNQLCHTDIKNFINEITISSNEYRFLITLKKKYVVPLKLVLIYNKNISYTNKKTLVPIVSFAVNNNYNFKSLASLIINKEQKLKNVYISELSKNNIKYDKFVLLIHPIDYPIDILPELIYNELKDLFIKTKYDAIIIILHHRIMVINKYYYVLY